MSIDSPAHFKGKDALSHVAEAQAQGLLASTEIHGTEVPGHLASFADAARESAMAFLLMGVILSLFHLTESGFLFLFSLFAGSWIIWKFGRSAWLGWSRLERLHRVLEQEKWEIEHHRPQEREELKELYSAKGFEGKLLEDVLDVLMADDERLLRVMVQEELNLSLETHEHPLKQAIGALIGSCGAFIICLIAWFLFSYWGLVAGALMTVSVSSGFYAYFAGNRLIPAIIWSLGLATVTFAFLHFLGSYFAYLEPTA